VSFLGEDSEGVKKGGLKTEGRVMGEGLEGAISGAIWKWGVGRNQWGLKKKMG
jgi:hypothetical protein